ncbi:hypothetical protein F5Y17DRAFT_462876 [Xylariaceae sp. FL0594]|nr:hypothetical protein F5Y17DRAFT_462876 [Xylariaceae sp. FL0594]
MNGSSATKMTIADMAFCGLELSPQGTLRLQDLGRAAPGPRLARGHGLQWNGVPEGIDNFINYEKNTYSRWGGYIIWLFVGFGHRPHPLEHSHPGRAGLDSDAVNRNPALLCAAADFINRPFQIIIYWPRSFRLIHIAHHHIH